MSKLPFIPLTAISPIDGRYREQVEQLALYFSEYALIGYRVDIEIKDFLSLDYPHHVNFVNIMGYFSLNYP